MIGRQTRRQQPLMGSAISVCFADPHHGHLFRHTHCATHPSQLFESLTCLRICMGFPPHSVMGFWGAWLGKLYRNDVLEIIGCSIMEDWLQGLLGTFAPNNSRGPSRLEPRWAEQAEKRNTHEYNPQERNRHTKWNSPGSFHAEPFSIESGCLQGIAGTSRFTFQLELCTGRKGSEKMKAGREKRNLSSQQCDAIVKAANATLDCKNKSIKCKP